MRGLSGLAWRSLVARRLRTGLTIVGIALGVGVLYAALATNAGIDASVDRTVADLVGRADLRVAAFTGSGLSDATLTAIRGTPGIATAAPEIERPTYLAASPTAPSGAPLTPVTVLGIDPAADPAVHDLSLAAGSRLAQPGEPSALITERLARAEGIGLGGEIAIDGSPSATPDQLRFRVIGILAGDGPLVGSAGRTIVVPIARAEAALGLAGPTSIDLALSPGTDLATAEASLEARLTNEPYILSSPADLAASLRASTADFRSTVALVAAVALFAGTFLIFNTLSMTVAERLRELGLLRAAGATRRQLVAFVLAGALALGVLGSIAGIIIGFVMAVLVTAWVGQVGSVTLAGIAVPPAGIALAVAIGVLVTLAAALEPAIRAGRGSPSEALRPRLGRGAGPRARLRWLVGSFAAVGVAGILLWPGDAGFAAAERSLAVYALLLAVVLASPFVLAPLARAAGLPFAAAFRLEERLARGAVVRDRSRAALTVGALTVGLAMIVALGGLAENARLAATAWLGSVVPGDEVVTSIRPIALDDPAVETLSVPGVARVTPVAVFDTAFRGSRLDAAAIVGADLAADGRLVFDAGDRSTALTGLDGGGTTILPRTMADRLGVRLGDTMAVTAANGTTAPLRVTGIVERSIPGRAGEAMLVGWRDATTLFGVAGADFFAVRFVPGAAPTARPALETAARVAALEPTPISGVEGAISDALGRVFGLFDGLAAVAVIVAALGIVNTLTMNVLERVREIGVLRAAGMTRRQVGRMVVVEAGILGVVGAGLGIATGLLASWLMIALAAGDTGVAPAVPWPSVGLALGLGVGLAMSAAYYPARLASAQSIARAVQAE